MEKRVVILGDLHLRDKEPFKQSARDILKWITNNPIINNPETVLVHLGDFLDCSINNGTLNEISLGFFKCLANRKIYVVSGNHDQDRDSSALEVLETLDNVEVIKEETFKTIQDKNFLFLPHIYTDEKGTTMEERYSNLSYEEEIDYCFAHIFDETKKFHKKQRICDLSNLNIKQRVFGHDHSFNLDKGGNYLGSLQPNSASEKGNDHYGYLIDFESDEDSFIPIPKYIEYYSVSYPDPLPEIEVKYPILNIMESLDRNDSVNFYREEAKKKDIMLTINKVFRKKVMNDKEEIESEGEQVINSDLDYFEQFQVQKELSEGVSTIIRRIIT